MGGGAIQLAAYGAQDVHLTGNPQITFFKMVYRRHTNFATEVVEHSFNTTPAFGGKFTCTVPRKGDLLGRTYLKMILPAIPSCSGGSVPTNKEINSMAYWIPRLGHSIINKVSVDIGGHQIDEQSGSFINVYDELTRSAEMGPVDKGRYDDMIGNIDGKTTHITRSPLTKLNYPTDLSNGDGSLYTGVPMTTFIDGYNKDLKIVSSSVQYIANLTTGFYTGLNLASGIEDQINSISGLSGFSSTFYKGNNTISIKSSGSFSVLGNSTANLTLGITGDLTGTVVSSRREINLFPLLSCKDAFPTIRDDLGSGNNVVESRTVYVPLQFWFCKNYGVALPLISLSEHEVRIHVELRSLTDLFYGWDGGVNGSAIGTLQDCVLCTEYVYLDTDERRRFAQAKHEYLIEQVQSSSHRVTGSSMNIELNLSHPVKELVWTVQDDRWVAKTSATGTAAADRGKRYDKEFHEYEMFNSTNIQSDWTASKIRNGNPVSKAQLFLDGQDRFSEMPGEYFNMVAPYSYHTNIPKSNGINVYSFALKPEEHQPSGSCNFSKVDNAVLKLSLNTSSSGTVNIHAVNYNILRVMGGMGALAYVR